MNPTRILVWMVGGLIAVAAGCASYYKVTDPASGKAYYTTKVNEADQAGAVKFEDEKTGSTVTLQSSEVKEISSEVQSRSLERGDSREQAKPLEIGASRWGPACRRFVSRGSRRPARSGRFVNTSSWLGIDSGDLRSLQSQPRHQPLLAENERVDIAPAGRRGHGLPRAGIHHDNARPHADLPAAAFIEIG